ncbi:ABC transporter permease [Litorivicinus lipolyticus]|uniref:ABC transporter permease n=1 Tax=Litorivicinus lipolyticus TaxID=418701 RepID=A0A5Q2QA25_9GAMM|nr:ABC transporter permease [Litorivicinus lipolyticus]QGG81178.1 ABC transporter permease [Litorivicinus lipolyticus]
MSAPQTALPGWIDYGLIPLTNLLLAFLVAGCLVLLIGENPIEAVQLMLEGALGFGEGIGFTLFYATSFILTGLAVAVAFHGGLFNIGGEGQAYVAGLGVTLVALSFDTTLHWSLVMLLAMVAAALFGGLWALVPAWLQAKRGSHVVITTIMFNFIASSLMVYLLVNVLSPEGSMAPESRTFEVDGRIPKLDGFMQWFGVDIGSAPLNASFFVALIACVAVYLLIWKTRLGYEIRAFGANPTAAAYAGINPVRITLIAMMLSGALAGLMALNPVMGDQARLNVEFVGGAGFVGIAVALMGRAHPVGIVLASILFGMLYQGGAELAFEKPNITRDLVIAIQGLVILFVGALEHLTRPWVARAYARVAGGE